MFGPGLKTNCSTREPTRDVRPEGQEEQDETLEIEVKKRRGAGGGGLVGGLLGGPVHRDVVRPRGGMGSSLSLSLSSLSSLSEEK